MTNGTAYKIKKRYNMIIKLEFDMFYTTLQFHCKLTNLKQTQVILSEKQKNPKAQCLCGFADIS